MTRRDDRDKVGGQPGDGAGRRDETGRSGVYPVSASAGASGDAPLRGENAWGQGERGAAGYQDHGDAGLITLWPESETRDASATATKGGESGDDDQTESNPRH